MRQWRLLLPNDVSLHCESVILTSQSVMVTVSSTAETGFCPRCLRPSTAIHSRYQRTLADLPWQGEQVVLKLNVRKFFCRNPHCSQSVFTERLPHLAAPHARQTHRLMELLRHLAVTTGGQAGARVSKRSGICISPTSLLRIVRRMPLPSYSRPAVVGVDDWAYRKGHRYGSIVCDLERHRPLDLLPERSADLLAEWLRRHPDIHTISRDRGDDYIRGTTLGAPQAIQVADRWHLLRNLCDALVRVIDRHRSCVSMAARMKATAPSTTAPAAIPHETPLDSPTKSLPANRAEEIKQMKRQKRLARYQEVMALYHQGVSVRAIASKLDIHRETVRTYVRSPGFPERAASSQAREIDPYVSHLRQRWKEGCHNAILLHRGLQQRGFGGTLSTVRRYLSPWRRAAAKADSAFSRPRIPSSKQVAVWLVKRPDRRTPEEQTLLRDIGRCNDALQTAADLAEQFAKLVRGKQVSALPRWLSFVAKSPDQRELQRFAKGLREDLAAVGAAIALPWSNGPVEGQINRLKLIKRQMYGRGKFDLLRLRFLGAA